jgi:hypothetical protein
MLPKKGNEDENDADNLNRPKFGDGQKASRSHKRLSAILPGSRPVPTRRRALDAEELATDAMPEKPAALFEPFEVWPGEMESPVVTATRTAADPSERASSWTSRGTLRQGIFGQHFGFNGHGSQSSLLAR